MIYMIPDLLFLKPEIFDGEVDGWIIGTGRHRFFRTTLLLHRSEL